MYKKLLLEKWNICTKYKKKYIINKNKILISVLYIIRNNPKN